MTHFFALAEFYKSGPDPSDLLPGELKQLAREKALMRAHLDVSRSLFGANSVMPRMRRSEIADAQRAKIDPDAPVTDVAAFLVQAAYTRLPPKGSAMSRADPHGYFVVLRVPRCTLRVAALYCEAESPRVGLFRYDYATPLRAEVDALVSDGEACDALWTRVCAYPR